MIMLQRSIISLVLGLSVAGCLGSGQAVQPSGPTNELEKRYTDNPNDISANLQLGEASEMQGDLLRAEQYYVRAEALGHPPDEIVPRILRVLVRAKRYEEALNRCRERLAKKPEDRATRFLFAALLQGRERNDLAESELKLLIASDDKDAPAHLAIGRLYRDAYKDATRAVPHLKKYLELAPTSPEAAGVKFELAELQTLDAARSAE